MTATLNTHTNTRPCSAHGDWSSSFHLVLILLLAICYQPNDWIVNKMAEIYCRRLRVLDKRTTSGTVHCVFVCALHELDQQKPSNTRLSLSMYTARFAIIVWDLRSQLILCGLWNVWYSPRNLCDLLRMSCCRCWFVLILLAVCGRMFFSWKFKDTDRDNPIVLQINRNERRQHQLQNTMPRNLVKY